MKFVLFVMFCTSISLGCNVPIKTSSSSSNAIRIDDSSKVTVGAYVKSPLIKFVAVDSHGVALDTDGDGIPDFKDKELLTLQRCFPVDSTGIGACPEPLCCSFKHWDIDPFSTCNIEAVKIEFAPKSKVLTPTAKRLLNTLANQVKANPYCKIILGTFSVSKKAAVELSWQRVNAVASFLVENQGVSDQRISFGLHLGEEDVVELVGDDFRSIIPAPPPKPRQ